MELGYLNILWMKHENMLNLIIWMKLNYVNGNIYMDDELDKLDVNETFHMDESQKLGMMWPQCRMFFLTLANCGNEDAK